MDETLNSWWQAVAARQLQYSLSRQQDFAASSAIRQLQAECDIVNEQLQPVSIFGIRAGICLVLTNGSLSQIQNSHDTTQRFDQLMAQQAIAIEYLATQTTTIETLRAEEHQLQIAKEASVDRGDDCEEARLSELMQDLSLARRAVRDFRTVSDYVAKSTAAQTGQDIGKVDIADSGFGAVGMSNIDQISDVKQRIGDVKVGNRATGFVGIHNNVDHNAALAAAAGRFSHMP
jgi:hypothetical protein